MMEQETIKHVATVRILLLGDAGVGKSKLTDLLARSVDTPTPSTRTVGDVWWNVQVRLHEYPNNNAGIPPTPEWTASSSSSSTTSSSFCCSMFSKSKSNSNSPNITLSHLSCEQFPRNVSTTCQMLPYFVEFYDLKSSLRLPREHRNRLYRHIDGIILVYDLLDMRTHDNLHDWLYRPLSEICRHRHRRMRPLLKRRHVPILVVGTKLDRLNTRRLRCSGKIAAQLGTDEILINALDMNSFAEKTRNEAKLRKFLNNVVEFKQYFPAKHNN